MATIIDSLVLQLGLDSKSFVKGQKEATEQFKKTKDGIVKSGGEIEGAAKKSTASIGDIQKAVLELFAVFTAGKGLKDFIADVTKTNAETGRLAKTLDMSVESLSSWEGAAQLAGGSSDGMAGSIQGLVSQFQQFYLTGQSSIVPYMNRLGVSMRDANGNMRNMNDVLLDLSDRFSKMDPARAAAFGHALGFDQGTINFLILGRKEVQKYLDLQKELGTVTKEQAKDAAELQFSWYGLVLASESLGRSILTMLKPALVFVADKLKDLAVWARGHGTFVKALFLGLAAAAAILGIALLAPMAEVIGLAAALAAAAAGFALLYDDWKTWSEGGKSALGGLWKYFTDWFAYVKDEFKLIKAIFLGNANDIRNAWHHLVTDLKKFFGDDLIGGIKKFGPKILEAFKQAFADAFDWLKGRFNTIWEAAFGHKLFDDSPTAGGSGSGAAARGAGADNRNWWQRTMPKWMGGKDAPSAAGGGRGVTAHGSLAANQQSAYQAARAEGLSDSAARALVANFSGESLRNPGDTSGDGGSAQGIGQWHGDRALAIKDHFGKYPSQMSVAEQTRAALWEMKTNPAYRESWNALHGKGSSGDMVGTLVRNYERPANPYRDIGTRLGYLGGFHPAALNHIAALHAINNSGKSTTNNTSSEVHIGAMHVHSRATDAAGLAKDFKPALKRHLQTNPANYALR
jgi:hypothetical protein